jgi:hypothetical protein
MLIREKWIEHIGRELKKRPGDRQIARMGKRTDRQKIKRNSTRLPPAVARFRRFLPRLHLSLPPSLAVQRRRGKAAAGRQRELLGLDPEDDVGPRRLSATARGSRPRRARQ